MNEYISALTALSASMTVVYNEKLPKRKWYARRLTLSEFISARCPVADAGLDNLAKKQAEPSAPAKKPQAWTLH